VIYDGIEIAQNSQYQIDSIDILALSTDTRLTADLLSPTSLTSILKATSKDVNGLWITTGSTILTGQTAIDAIANYFSPTIVRTVSAVNSVNGKTGDVFIHMDVEYSLIQDIKPSDSHGGTSRKRKWNVRELNTITSDLHSNVSLLKDDIILSAGTYRIHIGAPAKDVEIHKLRLYNETSSRVEFEGIALKSEGNSSYVSAAGVVVSNGTDLYEVQHYTEKKREKDGLGDAVKLGNNEVYTSVEIVKIGA